MSFVTASIRKEAPATFYKLCFRIGPIASTRLHKQALLPTKAISNTVWERQGIRPLLQRQAMPASVPHTSLAESGNRILSALAGSCLLPESVKRSS